MKYYVEKHVVFDSEHTVPQLDNIIRDIIELDPTGENFRYPHGQKEALFLQETSHINVAVFGEAMSFVKDLFSFWAEAFFELERHGH